MFLTEAWFLQQDHELGTNCVAIDKKLSIRESNSFSCLRFDLMAKALKLQPIPVRALFPERSLRKLLVPYESSSCTKNKKLSHKFHGLTRIIFPHSC